MTPEQRTAFAASYQGLIAAEMIDSERPEAHLNLGLLDVRRRQPGAAEAEYNAALRLDPDFVPALANLADLDRMRGQDQQGAELLRKAMAIEPSNADVRHALGLLLVRQRDYAGGLSQLRQATELAPEDAHYAYVYAIALNSTGRPAEAKALLERTHQQHPTDRDALLALVSIARDGGDFHEALARARELATLYPADKQIGGLVQQLEQPGAR
jgi:Flp pilus assembly protein TadD